MGTGTHRASALGVGLLLTVLAAATAAEDVDGVIEHGLLERYPGQVILWQQIDNHRPYRVPTGPVTGYRRIDDWVDLEGRVTRTFYRLESDARTWGEVYGNYRDALVGAGFELLAEGRSEDRKGRDVGSRQWTEVVYRTNSISKPGAVNSLFAGTASSGGAGALVASKDRAAGPVYVVISVEQHSARSIGALVDIIEPKPLETGLVAVDAEAIGSDIAELGRVVLDGLYFDFDKATLQPRSDVALGEIATYLQAHPGQRFHVVGHTDAVGALNYNMNLSRDRARAVVAALRERHGIPDGQLEAHGVGPLVPVFSNADDAGRARNRRVELVEWPGDP